MDKELIEKGKKHFERHMKDYLKAMSIEDISEMGNVSLGKMGESFSGLFELVYQDGRTDALMELYGKLKEEVLRHGEGNEKGRGLVVTQIEKGWKGVLQGKSKRC